MRQVTLVQEYVPTYRVALFERLADRLESEDISFDVLVAAASGAQAERGDSAGATRRQSPVRQLHLSFGSRSLRWKSVWRRTANAELVICELASGALENYPLALRPGTRWAAWGHGYPATSNPNRVEEALEAWLLRRSDHFFAYTERGRREAMADGYPAGRITVLRNTIDAASLRRDVVAVDDRELQAFQSDLGVEPNRTCAFIGGLDSSKRLEFLLEASAEISCRVPGFGLIVAGDGAQRQMIEQAADQHRWLHYVGFADNRMKALVARSSVALLNPGRVGLIAVDSFALGTPIITTNWSHHAPEFEYLEHGANAVVADNSVEAFVGESTSLLGQADRSRRLGQRCWRDVDNYGIDGMADRFADGVISALGDRRAGQR